MRGLWIDSGQVSLRGDLPEPEVPTGEVPVAVHTVGVCATDLALVAGYMDFRGVPGHEFVGTALAGKFIGRRVVGEINAACGGCEACRAGNDRHCRNRTVLGIAGRPGAFAERLALPERNLLPVPDGVPNRHAVFCEPLAAALAIGEQVQLVPGARALVAGDGRLGLLCAQVLRLAGLEVALAGRHPERASWLSAGAADPGDLPRVRPLTGWLEDGGAPEGARGTFDLAVEATGNPDVLARVLPLVRPRGTVVLKTTAARPARLDLAPLVVDELTLVGSRCGRFGPALELLASGRVIVEPLLHGRYPLEQGPAAFARAGRPGTLKVLVDIEPA